VGNRINCDLLVVTWWWMLCWKKCHHRILDQALISSTVNCTTWPLKTYSHAINAEVIDPRGVNDLKKTGRQLNRRSARAGLFWGEVRNSHSYPPPIKALPSFLFLSVVTFSSYRPDVFRRALSLKLFSESVTFHSYLFNSMSLPCLTFGQFLHFVVDFDF